MSSVRMCDKCGRVFSESEENWSTGTGVQFYTDDKGRRAQRDRQSDQCGTCNGTPQDVRPNLGVIEASRTETLERDELFARIQNLETQAASRIPPIQGKVE